MNKTLFLMIINLVYLSSLNGREPAIIELTEANYEAVMTSSSYLILDIYVLGCGPCQKMTPIFKQLNQEYGKQMTFAKLNGQSELVENFELYNFPTVVFLINGKQVGMHSGFNGKQALVKDIQRYFAIKPKENINKG